MHKPIIFCLFVLSSLCGPQRSHGQCFQAPWQGPQLSQSQRLELESSLNTISPGRLQGRSLQYGGTFQQGRHRLVPLRGLLRLPGRILGTRVDILREYPDGSQLVRISFETSTLEGPLDSDECSQIGREAADLGNGTVCFGGQCYQIQE